MFSSVSVKGGKIVLSGGSKGTVNVAGKLKASGGAGQKAGSVKVTGKNIKVAQTANITADADSDQDAGDIETIATGELTIDGILSAQGLAGTGFIETSAPTTSFGLNASILATREWLLDPTNIIIDNPLATLIEGQLTIGDQTTMTPAAGADAGDIDVNALVEWTTANTFTLIADNDINFNAGGGINATEGNFVAQAGDDIRMLAGNADIRTREGDITLTAVNQFTLVDGLVKASGGDIVIDNGDSFEALSNSIQNSGDGTIEINQNKNVDTDVAITATIQNAIDAVHNVGSGRNTINVGAGTWVENVKANHRNMTLNGANAGTAGDDVRVAETLIAPCA